MPDDEASGDLSVEMAEYPDSEDDNEIRLEALEGVTSKIG